MEAHLPSQFMDALASILEIDENLTGDDRGHLSRWRDDPTANRNWAQIKVEARKQAETKAKAQGRYEDDLFEFFESPDFARVFIREVLAARQLADSVDNWPDYLGTARCAESVARLLRGSPELGLPPALPTLPNYMELVRALEMLAPMLRERAVIRSQSSVMHVSREDVNQSRKCGVFMRLIADLLNSICGPPRPGRLRYGVVADLTDIAFPRSEATTIDQVSAALKAVRRGRSIRSGQKTTTSTHRLGKR
jgi:hypothetical protein